MSCSSQNPLKLFMKSFCLCVVALLLIFSSHSFADEKKDLPWKNIRFGTKKEQTPPPKHQNHSLELSDEVVDFRDFGRKIPARPLTLTEVIEDKAYPENVERRKMLDARPLDDVNTEIPERKNLLGKDRFHSPVPIYPGFKSGTGA